jgi:uncharacterized protein (TIGR00255 family)
MIYSMTGYAAVTDELPFGGLSLDLRSVNHRYLDIQFRLPDELRLLESTLRERITSRIGRGKVECRVGFTKRPDLSAPMQLDEGLLSQLTKLDEKVQAALPKAESLRVNDVLRWPGMLGGDALPIDLLTEKCLRLVDQAIDDLSAARARRRKTQSDSARACDQRGSDRKRC